MVEVKNLNLVYGKEKVLKGISLRANKGECVLVTGKSGSGKSSIINSINGLASKYCSAEITGDILVEGKNIRDMDLYEISTMISTVFQNTKTYFFNVNTTLELLFYLENIGLSREEMDKRLNDMLKIFPIKDLLNRDIFMLSGGEKQILCLAACYIAGTKVIVMDEPSSNLDKGKIEVIHNMMGILKSKGTTLIIGEHRIYYLMDLLDKVYLIEDGKVKGKYGREEFANFSQKELKDLGLRDKELTKLKVAPIKNKGDFFIKNLTYKFENSEKSLEVKNLHFESGKIYGIIGPNGKGKSTLLRCLIGVYKGSKDEIYFRGKKLSKKARLKMSSLVMQDVNHQLFTDDLEEEISLGIKNFDREKGEKILKDLDLFQFKGRHPMSLSGGQKQRLAIGSVLCKDSSFIYFDEPTSGMDYSNMIKISKLIRKFKSEDRIIFIVSHDIEFLNEVADGVYSL